MVSDITLEAENEFNKEVFSEKNTNDQIAILNLISIK